MIERTEEFQDTATQCATRLGLSQAKLTEMRSSQILRPSRPTSAFYKTAHEISDNIATMRTFIAAHKKEYVEEGRISESDRDSIESEIGLFVRACKERVDALNAMIQRESGKLGAHPAAHRQGMVLILCEKLHRTTSTFDKCRSVRFQQSLDRKAQDRRHRLPPNKGTAVGVKGQTLEPRGGGAGPGEGGAEGQEGEQQQDQAMAEDQRALLEELGSLGDAVRDTEGQVMEISQLSSLFSTHVLQQAQQIEQLYEDAVSATVNLERGNVELRKTIERRGGSTCYVFVLLMMASVGLLLLDWIN